MFYVETAEDRKNTARQRERERERERSREKQREAEICLVQRKELNV